VTATIRDIADRLGISQSTVSRALRDSPLVAEETKNSVWQVARELDYTPNLLARSLARASSTIIGCVIMEFSNPFFVPLVQAVQEEAERHGYIVVVGESKRQQGVENQLVQRLRAVRAAGVITLPVMEDLNQLLALREEGVPVVIVGRDPDLLDYVNTDNVLGGLMVGRHLMGLGHERIGAIISGEPFNTPEQQRLQGLRAALSEAGLGECEEHLFVVDDIGIPGGERAAGGWLALPERPSAVFATNDRLAMGFIRALRRAGVRLPGEVAVVGYDDISFAPFLQVPLTTVALPSYELGHTAAELLFRRIEQAENGAQVERIILQPRLVVRESCGGKKGFIGYGETVSANSNISP
jgi:LacI family transcriptional regulator